MRDQSWVEPKTSAAAERKMQAFARTQEIADRTTRIDQPEVTPREVASFIALSREAGASGSNVAEVLGQKLGWEVLDKDVLDKLADRYQLSRPVLEAVDETTMSWAYDIFGAWLDREIVSHEKYLTRLNRIFLTAAKKGNAIFVGRGAQFLLPRDRGFAVRLVASESYRIHQLMEQHNLPLAKARQMMNQLDRGRRQFVRHFFHHDVDDPHIYDLVINVERFGVERTADLIIQTLPM
jgi:cytidylate kinase